MVTTADTGTTAVVSAAVDRTRVDDVTAVFVTVNCEEEEEDDEEEDEEEEESLRVLLFELF